MTTFKDEMIQQESHNLRRHSALTYAGDALVTASMPQRAPVLNALTIDVEDYFQVSGFENKVNRAEWPDLPSRLERNTHKILDILQQNKVHATFFILGWVADHFPEVVRTISAAGHEIGCHSYWHNLVYRQSPASFREDLRRARDAIQSVIAAPIIAYRAPSFSITHTSVWAFDILIEEGFEIDSSVFPVRHDRYGMPTAPRYPSEVTCASGTITEFPPSVWECMGVRLPVAGGGYFRLFPYRWTYKTLLQLNQAHRPGLVYLHPWEFDPKQPRMPGSFLSRLRHYVNILHTGHRFKRLVRELEFTTLSRALANYRRTYPLEAWKPSTLANLQKRTPTDSKMTIN